MKKILFIICISFYLICSSNAAGYKVGKKVSDIFEPVRNFKIDLPPGEWVVTQSASDAFYGLRWRSYILVRLENGKFAEGITFEEIHTAGVYEYVVNNAIVELIFKNKYDGCYERPEYFYLNFYRKGSTHNCFRVGHRNINKRIYDPRDPEQNSLYSQLKKWLEENLVNLPKVGFWSSHSYFSRRASSNLYNLHYYADPSIVNAPENKYFTEETSEYHKNRIKNFPEHEKSMKKWMSISTQRHKNFEKTVRVLDKHLLNLDEFTLENSKSNNNTKASTEIIKEIQTLNELYKDGVLTKDEFEKAKKKILN